MDRQRVISVLRDSIRLALETEERMEAEFGSIRSSERYRRARAAGRSTDRETCAAIDLLAELESSGK